jgi:hypothetical protein
LISTPGLYRQNIVHLAAHQQCVGKHARHASSAACPVHAVQAHLCTTLHVLTRNSWHQYTQVHPIVESQALCMVCWVQAVWKEFSASMRRRNNRSGQACQLWQPFGTRHGCWGGPQLGLAAARRLQAPIGQWPVRVTG